MADFGEFTVMATPQEDDDNLFGDQLATLTDFLRLPPPEFRGKHLQPTSSGDHCWLIEGNVRGRRVRTKTEDIVFYKESPTWEIGLQMAMQEALSRMLQTYREEIPQGSAFYALGRRFEDGTANRTVGDRGGMDYRVIQMEDLECHIVNLEDNLTTEMSRNASLRVSVEKLKHVNTELTMALRDMDDKVLARDSEIAQLKKAMMPKETPAVPQGQEMQNEEEDPEELIALMPNGDEKLIVSEEQDTPASNTRSHPLRTISARAYLGKFYSRD